MSTETNGRIDNILMESALDNGERGGNVHKGLHTEQ